MCDTGTTKGPSGGGGFGWSQLQICKLPLSHLHYYYKPFFALLFPTGSFSHPPPLVLPSGTPTTCLPSSSYSPPYSILFQKLFGVVVYACVCLCVGLLPALRVLISSTIHFGLFVRPPHELSSYAAAYHLIPSTSRQPYYCSEHPLLTRRLSPPEPQIVYRPHRILISYRPSPLLRLSRPEEREKRT